MRPGSVKLPGRQIVRFISPGDALNHDRDRPAYCVAHWRMLLSVRE